MSSTCRSTRQRAASISPSEGDTSLRPEPAASAVMPTQGPPLPTAAYSGAGDPFLTMQFILELAWPGNLCLDHAKSNWEEWCLQMSLITDHHGFTDWLDGSFLQLDISTDAKGHRAWRTNN